jgi:hypothetical protein
VFHNSCKNLKVCWIFSLTSVTSLRKLVQTFGKISPVLVRLIILLGIIWTKNECDKISFRRYYNQTTAMLWTCPKNGGREATKRSTEMAAIREKKTR